jgi:hypothetical protein
MKGKRSMAKKTQQKKAPPTVITLTLAEEDGDARSGTLLIQRGELAHARQFSYASLGEIAAVLKDAVVALSAVEADPPVIPDMKRKSGEGKTGATAAATTPAAEEPTIDVPTRKGAVAVKMSHLKIVAGETDAATYRQATLAAGRFIDGKLWDGVTPIRFDDVAGVQRKLQHLTDKDLSLFTLDDFVQVGSAPDQPEARADPVQGEDDSGETNLEAALVSTNGSQPATGESGE